MPSFRDPNRDLRYVMGGQILAGVKPIDSRYITNIEEVVVEGYVSAFPRLERQIHDRLLGGRLFELHP